MADSGILWIDIIYDWCVYLLIDAAQLLGISYEEINVWLFVFILPLILLISFAFNVVLFAKLKSSENI